MLIAFVHTGKAFLPGINAYINFFQKSGIETTVVLQNSLAAIRSDLEWHFMGTHLKKVHPSSTLIHEYASASVPPLAEIKNLLKRRFNVKPDYRVFLNEYVRSKMRFNDNIPYGFRDIGLSDEFLRAVESTPAEQKKYDFIYSGSTTKDLRLEKLLCHFQTNLKERSILVISQNYEGLQKKFSHARNIFFAGPVPQAAIPDYLRLARFAINYKPDVEPHNRQTVTKLIEYAACRIPIITSDLAWVRQFEKEHGGSYFYLKQDLSNFTWENVHQMEYSFPDVSNRRWDEQIINSGVVEFISTRFPSVNWKM